MKNTVSFLLLALASLAFSQAPPPALKVESIPNPTTPGSLQANLAVTQDGNPLLSWVEPSKDGSFALRYAVRQGTGWSEPRTIAANRKFFHHPAELPEVLSLKGGSLLAHWIEMPSEKSEAEFLYVSGSRDGVQWNAPSMAHHDRSQAQHGLASIVASGDREASLFWLQALKGEDGPVSLMRTVIDAEGKEIKEESLDSDVCACCPTAVTRTTRGLLVAYRDHTPEDIRDISVTRFESGRWTSPKTVYADKWQLNACPINAASVSAKGDRVAISWYTAAGDKPRVELALSNDGGQTFGKPITVSTGQAYGYTSIAIDIDGGALVSWLERGGGDGARVLARHVGTDGAAGPVLQVATGTRQNLGYPRLVVTGSQAWITWNAAAKAQTARLR
jgi:hypothetical protein